MAEQEDQAIAEGERLRAELAAAREQHRQVVAALRTEADHARQAVQELTDERDRLLREVEHLRAAIEGVVQLDTQNVEHGEEAELRLAHVAALLVRLAGRVSTKTGKRLLEAAQHEVYRVHAELSQLTSLMDGGGDPDDREGSGNGCEQGGRADVVICVHNALEDVRSCLTSVVRHTGVHQRVIVVDDGSAAECADYLRDFARSHSQVTLLRNEEPLGYTKAANQGLRESSGEMVVLLNSDTIVPPRWLNRLVECALSDPGIGIVGPLSNAASFQSVPERFQPNGDWAVNPLPPGWDIDQMAATVAKVSDRDFPRVPFVNGFCFLITRAVIDTIGYLDEESFPDGYGEENDYCLRAADAGFELAIADHAYVYHAKSRSYSHKRRHDLDTAGRNVLFQKFGVERLQTGLKQLGNEPALAKMRLAVTTELQATRSTFQVPGILFILPVSGGYGGIHSVVQEAAAMRRLGIDAQIAVQSQHLWQYQANYPAIDTEQLFFGFHSPDELQAHAPRFGVVVGTIHTSMPLVAAITTEHPAVIPAYYIQDYEPLFHPEGLPAREAAARSYTLVPDTVLFAKTQWLCDIVRMRHGVDVHKVSPSLDHDVYFPPPDQRQRSRVRVSAMIRPGSPRRGAWRTMKILRRLVREFGRGIAVHTFGCTDSMIEAAGLPTDFRFTNHGTLTREQVAKLLRDTDIFLDLSDYQAFGRTGLEAMACGCAVVVPALGGADEYAMHRVNALVVDTSRSRDCYDAASELVADSKLRRRLQRAGVEKAKEFSIERAALSELEVLSEAWLARQHSNYASTAMSGAPVSGRS